MDNYDQGHGCKETVFPVANSFGDMPLFAYVCWIKEKDKSFLGSLQMD